jgi:hypothetical protein
VRWESSFKVASSELRIWFGQLAGGWTAELDDHAWQMIGKAHGKALGDVSPERQREAALEFGPRASELIDELLRRVA